MNIFNRTLGKLAEFIDAEDKQNIVSNMNQRERNTDGWFLSFPESVTETVL